MNLMKKLLKTIRAMLLKNEMDYQTLNSRERIIKQRQILLKSPLLRNVFRDFYTQCMRWEERFFVEQGASIELGAGTGFFNTIHSSLFSSDLIGAPHLDFCADALALPVKSGQLKSLFAINCFHHVADPMKFLQELQRVLKPGGGAVFIEPFYGPLAQLFYSVLFDSEHFDLSQSKWQQQSDVMSNANQALPAIVFVRDRVQFEALFPSLEIIALEPCTNYLQYIASGGVNFHSLIPLKLLPLVQLLEKMLLSLRYFLALHMTIVVRKRSH